jgi:hypothetical protein
VARDQLEFEIADLTPLDSRRLGRLYQVRAMLRNRLAHERAALEEISIRSGPALCPKANTPIPAAVEIAVGGGDWADLFLAFQAQHVSLDAYITDAFAEVGRAIRRRIDRIVGLIAITNDLVRRILRALPCFVRGIIRTQIAFFATHGDHPPRAVDSYRLLPGVLPT